MLTAFGCLTCVRYVFSAVARNAFIQWQETQAVAASAASAVERASALPQQSTDVLWTDEDAEVLEEWISDADRHAAMAWDRRSERRVSRTCWSGGWQTTSLWDRFIECVQLQLIVWSVYIECVHCLVSLHWVCPAPAHCLVSLHWVCPAPAHCLVSLHWVCPLSGQFTLALHCDGSLGHFVCR